MSVSKQGFTLKHWWNEVGIVMLATQKVSHILSQFEEPQRAIRLTKTVRYFLILIFSQYASIKFFY